MCKRIDTIVQGESLENVGVDSNIHVFAFEVNYANHSISGVNAKIKGRSGFFRSRETLVATPTWKSMFRQRERENGDGFTTLKPFLSLFILAPSLHIFSTSYMALSSLQRPRIVNARYKRPRARCLNYVVAMLFHYFVLTKFRLKLRGR